MAQGDADSLDAALRSDALGYVLKLRMGGGAPYESGARCKNAKFPNIPAEDSRFSWGLGALATATYRWNHPVLRAYVAYNSCHPVVRSP
jgi:hypothetical protein